MAPVAEDISEWETFEFGRVKEDQFTLKCQGNGKFVTAERGGGSFMTANKEEAGDWEKFKVQDR